MADKIQIRRDTAANWTTQNPVLSQGELGAETDTLKIKMGDASSTWNQLNYLIDTGNYATNAQLQTAVSDLVDAAPGALDTLNELAAALGDDPNFATTVTNAIALKATTSTLADVATSGDYTDLSNTPTIPAAYGDADVSAYLAANDFGTSTSVIAAITDSAPGTLDTLNELAAALGDDANFSTTVTNSIATKANSADLSAVATSGAYADLSGTPTLSGVATSGAYGDLTGRPTLFSGAYADLTGSPTIPSDLTDVGVTDGTAGQVLTTDGAGNFSFADTAGGGGSFEAVASGNLSNGDPVVINADGTVSTAGLGASSGTKGQFNEVYDAVNNSVKMVTDRDSGKVIVLYEDRNNNYYPTVEIGSISGETITFGAPTVIRSSRSEVGGLVSMDGGKFLVKIQENNYLGNGWYFFLAVCTITGDTITTGSLTQVNDSINTTRVFAYDPPSGQIIDVYHSGSSYYKARLITISGTTASIQAYGTGPQIGGQNAQGFASVYDPDTQQHILFMHDGPDNPGWVSRIFTMYVSGGAVSVGPSTVVTNTTTGNKGIAYDTTNNKAVLFFTEETNDKKFMTATVTAPAYGSTITLGDRVAYDPGEGSSNFYHGGNIVYDPTAEKFVVTINKRDDATDGYDSHAFYVTLSAAGAFSFGSTFALTADDVRADYQRIHYSSASNGAVLGYMESNVDYRFGVSTLSFQAGAANLTEENYAGIADANYTNGATATIQTAGAVDDAQSGLTPGQTYYLQTDGTLLTTAGDPSVFAGTALTATTLLVGKTPPAAAGYTDGNVQAYLTANNYMPGAHYNDASVAAYLSANDYATATSTIATITDSAPATLDTLNELAAALGDDANFSTTVTNSIALKANSADLNAVATSGAYADLSGTPALSAVATSGAYADLSGTPTLSGVATSGAYADLSGAPSIPSALTDIGIADGTNGQFLRTNGAGTFEFGDVAVGGGGGSFEAVASGALENGDKVLVNADGTVSVVAPIPNPAGPGTIATFATNPNWVASTFDSNSNKVVIIYEDVDNNEYGTAIVGTVSGSTISFGSPVVFENSNDIQYANVTFDSNSNKVVANYVLDNSSGKAVVGDVSGTSITFGTPVTYAGRHGNGRLAFDSNENKIAIVYQNTSGSGYGTVVIGDVSGTSISFGSPTVFNSANSDQPRVAFDANANKLAIQYKNFGNSFYLEAIVGTISGTSVSFGSSTTFESSNAETGDVVFDPDSNKVIYSYKPTGSEGRAIVGTISGTSISFGASAVFEPSGGSPPSGITSVYDTSNNKVLVGYGVSGSGLFVAVGTVSGTSITFDTPVLIDANGGSNIDLTYDSNSDKPVVSYRSDSSGEGKAVTFQTVAGADTFDLTSENFVGISDAAYADGATATIQSAGAVDDAQSGLTAGQAYFLLENGTLSTTAGDPRVFAGVALSATTLLIGKDLPPASYADSDVAAYLAANDFATSTATIAAITDSAPATLDTLNELAAALGDDANFSTTVTNSIAAKANTADLNAVATSGAYADLSGTPTLAAVATSGAYGDITGVPTIPSALTDIGISDGTNGQVLTTNGAGTFSFQTAATPYGDADVSAFLATATIDGGSA